MARPPRKRTNTAKILGESARRIEKLGGGTPASVAGDVNDVVIGRQFARGDHPHGSDVILDLALLEALFRDLSMPKPLMLLPMRLEYRVVQQLVPIGLSANTRALLADDADAQISDSRRPARLRLKALRRRRRAGDNWTLSPGNLILQTRQEIWFRWFPDDSFARRGIAPATETELQSLKRFADASGGQPWTAIDDPAVISAWQALSREIAPERALFLLRNPGGGDPGYQEALGKPAMLPSAVALFAMDATGKLTEIARGGAIDKAISYTVAGLQDKGWLSDFGVAVKSGMGVRISDKASVDKALAASWIIAVGLTDKDAAAELKALIEDRVASGDFAFLPQDTATNNAPNQPSPYKSPRADLAAFLRDAVAVEGGALSTPLQQAAELFSEAAGIDLATVSRAPGSADLAFEDARAMLRVIGPALIDTAVARTASIQDIDEEEVVEVFAEAIAARGALPPVRFGKNPFGVLPVISTAALEPLASDGVNARRIEKFIRDFASLIINQSQRSADALVPVLQPGDPQASEKLEAILKQNPVSRRIEVSTVGQANAKALGCAYVDSQKHLAAEYLAELENSSIFALADPTADDKSYPLLYRLARLSLTKCTLFKVINAENPRAEIKPTIRSVLTGIELEMLENIKGRFGDISLSALASRVPNRFAGIAGILQRTSAQFLAGLRRLQEIAAEPDGIAKLETLMMETIDLFQHRMDAWATGIAYRRLAKRRRAGLVGLSGGYFGMLSKLRPESVTGGTDGFIQAPSMDQARTAALLRSANLRHGGAFAIGLDSASVRQGLDLLDMLQAGISPGEALGYLGERLLHDGKQDTLIQWLRNAFPLRDPRDDSGLEIRLFDGMAFIARQLTIGMGPPGVIGPLVKLQATLREHFDALADIVMAEAVHLRGLGLADAANAWLQVLSGDTIPGLPSVLRTQRNGHASSHRVATLLTPADPAATDAPRAIAEPVLARFAEDRLSSGLAQSKVRVIVDTDGQPFVRDYALVADLGLQAIDLVVGGESEIVLRARHRFALDWRGGDPAIVADLGPLPDRGIVAYMNGQRPLTLDLATGGAPPAQLLASAAVLRRIAGKSRALEPSDLSAAASPAKPLTDDADRDLARASGDVLAGRASMLAVRIQADLVPLRDALGATVASARELRRQRDLGADASQISLLLAGLETYHAALDAALLKVSRYGEPAALRFSTTTEIADDPDELERTLAALVVRLQTKAAGLTAALPPPAPPANAAAARAIRNGLAAALSGALDGDALRILPPFPRSAETTPLLAAPTPVAAALTDWIPVRARMRAASEVFADDAWLAWANTDAATGADDPDADPRPDEGIAPRARLFCNLISTTDPVVADTFVGLVIDEWSERRPSRMQQAGVAINYDSPQSEAPQAILLCEPSGPGMGEWSPQNAAGMVAETIRLMKMRALSAQQRPLAGPLLRAANQVPFITVPGSPPEPRIPSRDYLFISALGTIGADVAFLSMETNAEVGIEGTGFNEVTGFGKVKE
ncbi:MAG: hypothetical protein EOS55_00670 [Mesorhizobium sp.]|nr:MAG: hypothetical protein EOS55_00670 [Mesorhizobium sp.]